MTFTKQLCCVPIITKTTEISPSQCGKLSKTEAQEILDDMNALCNSLFALDTALRRLNYLAQKKTRGTKRKEKCRFSTRLKRPAVGQA